MKTIKLQRTEKGEVFIPIEAFADVVDIDKIATYDIAVSPCKTCLIVTFCDHWNNKVDLKCRVEKP